MNRIVELSDGTQLTAIGQGAWNIGDSTATREAEISTLRRGVELGLTLIDTAEMYGSGRSEKLVGEAIAPIRDDVYLVDKVLPSNASAKGTEEACERSLRHLGLDHIDLYLLHWPGSYPVEETLMAFERLVDRGLIGDWGVSNVDLAELESYPENPLVNQVLYNPSSRGPELDLFPAMKQREIVAMAYSPVGQGELLGDSSLQDIAEKHDSTVAQLLLAWAIRDGNTIAIPKASTVEHVEDNARALELQLSTEDLRAIDVAFPAPDQPGPLELI
ncbi:oxidoreductase [Kocuria sp. WRN011]|uniref:Aldo/keto reductase n=2 Tax=Kocuria TaxID=57493 RepID=A0ABV3UZT4_9MICC|nr:MULTISPECIES: aldo/keto reductase [Kocuria]PBB08755.1 oxidoreductase [Kocuria sp. WRN011]